MPAWHKLLKNPVHENYTTQLATFIMSNHDTYMQRWAECMIVRSYETDSILQLYWVSQLVAFNFCLG